MKNSDTNQPNNGHHRLQATRLREGVSLRSLAKRLQVPISTAKAQEEGRCALYLSDLYRWQRALKVPISDLLDVPEPNLENDIRQRACLVRIIKTAKSLVQSCTVDQEARLARQIVDQVHEMMPELTEVSAWPEGRSRPLTDLGRAADVISTTEWMLTGME